MSISQTIEHLHAPFNRESFTLSQQDMDNSNKNDVCINNAADR